MNQDIKPDIVQKPNKLVWGILGIIILVGLGWGGYYYKQKFGNKTAVTEQEAISKSVKSTPVTKIIDPGVTWLSEPQKLDDLKLLKTESGSPITYYKIGATQSGSELIYAEIQGMGVSVYRFLKNADGKYYLLKNHSDYSPGYDEQLFDNEKWKNSTISVDYETTYVSLKAPEILTLNGVRLKKTSGGMWNNIFYSQILSRNEKAKKSGSIDNTSFQEIGETEYGKVIKQTSVMSSALSDSNVKNISYLLKLSDTSVEYYLVNKDFLADDGSLVAGLKSKENNLANAKYNVGFAASGTGSGGCGGGPADNSYIDTNIEQSFIQIGTTKSGSKLYTITDINSNLVKTAYAIYKIGRDFPGSQEKSLTIENFAGKKPLLLWKDGFNNFLVFMNKDYDALVECGKPVIYLYPLTTQNVSVKVGANITKSEPKYQDGWFVKAKPDGALITKNGEKYPNLYWEGKGRGIYPAITTGRVIETKNAEREIRADLIKLGLNNQEINDFLAFWLAKMPGNPYTRLTWLSTRQMNQLAPLEIAPKPETTIRVFLDFAGQDSPETNLIPQKLTKTERNGFTVVEWGGLLVGNK